MNIRTGAIICAKSVTHRIPVEIAEDKRGRLRVRANQFTYRFQGEHNRTSDVGVFVFLGTFPEHLDVAKVQEFATHQLHRLGWRLESATSADAVDPRTPDPRPPTTREKAV